MSSQLARIYWGGSASCFIYSFVIQAISGKTLCSNLRNIYTWNNNRNHNSYRFSYKFAFIIFLFVLINQKQESRFQQVAGLVTINIFVLFCLYRVAHYFIAMTKSLVFHKGLCLHVIPVCIIVPCIPPPSFDGLVLAKRSTFKSISYLVVIFYFNETESRTKNNLIRTSLKTLLWV